MFKSQEIKDLEDKIYERVANEMEDGEVQKGLWTKAKSESNGNEKQIESKYIKLRMQQLKDEALRHHADQKSEVKKKEKDALSIENLQTTAENVMEMFNFLAGLILLGGVLCLVSFYYELVLFTYTLETGISLVFVGAVLLYKTQKLKSFKDVYILKSKLNNLFLIMIPLALLFTGLGILFPILGLASFIIFIKLTIRAFKFNRSYLHAKNNVLIS